MLMSMMAAPRSALSRAASAMSSPSHPASCTITGLAPSTPSSIFMVRRVKAIIALLAIISVTTKPAPSRSTTRRNGGSVTPDIGAKMTGCDTATGPITMPIC